MDFESPKQHQTTTRRLAALAAVTALTVGGVAACASTTATPASAGPSTVPSTASTAPGASGSPSIQPGGPMLPVPSTSTPAPGPGTARPVPDKPAFQGTGYTSDGDELTVNFFAGICDSYGLRADQSTPGQVRVSIVVTQYPQPGTRCSMLVKEQHVSTDLGSPLDGRTVVDSASGRTLPQLDTPSGTKRYSPGPVKIGT
jgi:hypothetical protein